MIKLEDSKQRKKSFIDKQLILIILILMAISIVAIYLATPVMPYYMQNENYYVKQFVWYCISFFILFVILKLGVDRLFTGVKVLYWILLVLLFILLIDRYIIDIPDMFIKPINGTTAWFFIPALGSLQPSEFMKVVLVIRSGLIIHEFKVDNPEITYQNDLKLFLEIIKICILPIILIFLQPDSGLPLIMLFSIGVMLFVGGIKRTWIILAIILVCSIVFGIIFIYEYFPDFFYDISGGYRLNRIYGCLDSEKYYLSHGNQLYTSMLALGSSGMTGHELNQTIISIAEPQTDFIFTVIGQNFGFVGTLVTIIALTVFDLKLVNIGRLSDYGPEKIMLSGIIGMLIFQQIQNMGMVIGLLPITGITLPFISYGGSSILSYFIPLALAFHLSSETKTKYMH